jgi:hypothetical protein
MRFAEFKLLEAAGQVGYYTVGDSHAEGLAAYSGKPWINKAKHSMKSTEPMHMAAINSIPKGSVVVISLGANDAVATSDTPAVIANRVASIVNASVSNGNQTLFLLFPVGTSKNISTERRTAVRKAIQGAISVPITDLEGQPLQSDGVHAQPNVYAAVGKRLAASAKPSVQAKSKEQDNIAAKPSTGKLTGIAVPQTSLGWKGPEIMDIQKALVALGYNVGPTGTDGIRGKYTIAAIKKYQTDKGLAIDGDPGPETVAAINKDIQSNPTKFAAIAKSKPEEVKQSSKVGQTYATQPVAYDAVTKGKIGEVLNFVAGPESRGYYDMMFGSVRKPEILKMTIDEANRFQNAWGKRAGSSAMGRYQIMHFNTINYAQKAGLNPKKDLFSPENQDKMGIVFLQEKGLNDWLSGKMPDNQFLEGLSRVWAGIPSPSKGGNSYYGGVGLNKHQTQVSMNNALSTLQNIKAA